MFFLLSLSHSQLLEKYNTGMNVCFSYTMYSKKLYFYSSIKCIFFSLFSAFYSCGGTFFLFFVFLAIFFFIIFLSFSGRMFKHKIISVLHLKFKYIDVFMYFLLLSLSLILFFFFCDANDIQIFFHLFRKELLKWNGHLSWSMWYECDYTYYINISSKKNMCVCVL